MQCILVIIVQEKHIRGHGRTKTILNYSESGEEGQNPLPQSAGHATFDAAQDMVGLLGCEHTWPAHVQVFIHQYPQVLLCRAALNPFIPPFVLIAGVASTHVQDFAPGLVEFHEVLARPLLELFLVRPDSIPSFWCVSCTTQLGVICRPAEGVLNLSIYIHP